MPTMVTQLLLSSMARLESLVSSKAPFKVHAVAAEVAHGLVVTAFDIVPEV